MGCIDKIKVCITFFVFVFSFYSFAYPVESSIKETKSTHSESEYYKINNSEIMEIVRNINSKIEYQSTSIDNYLEKRRYADSIVVYFEENL